MCRKKEPGEINICSTIGALRIIHPPQYFGFSHSEPQLPTRKMWASQGWSVCWAGQSGLFFVAFSSQPSSLGAFLGFSTTPWKSPILLSPSPAALRTFLDPSQCPTAPSAQHGPLWRLRTSLGPHGSQDGAETTAASPPAGGSQRDVPAHHHVLRLVLQRKCL